MTAPHTQPRPTKPKQGWATETAGQSIDDPTPHSPREGTKNIKTSKNEKFVEPKVGL